MVDFNYCFLENKVDQQPKKVEISSKRTGPTSRETYLGTKLKMLTQLKALMLLDKCRGDEIWPVDVCRQEGVPENWIDELADATESGFQTDLDTLYVEEKAVNQFHGVQDLRLAYRLGEFLGVDTSQIKFQAFGRIAQVNAIREAIEED